VYGTEGVAHDKASSKSDGSIEQILSNAIKGNPMLV
jgi:hypothetical protein